MKTLFLQLLIVLLLIISCNTNPGKTPEEKIDYLVNKAYENGDFAGSVLVVNKGEIIYKRNFGMADAVHSIPISDSTTFLLASVSKPITAILILQFVEQGKIALNDSLSTYFKIENNHPASKITVHHLLTHTSGINELIHEDHAFEESDLHKINFHFEPGSNFKYSNTGYVILKEIAERISGKNFKELIAQNIIKKAQLSSMGVIHDINQQSGLAIGYKKTNLLEVSPIEYPLNIIDGAGSLYATASDLFKLDRALYTDKLLSKESTKLMQTQHVKERFGYGWFLKERSGIWDVMFHAGDLPGYSSFFSRRTKHDEVVILLSNVEELDLSYLENGISKILKFDN